MLIVTGSIAYDYIMEFPGKFDDHILPEHLHNINISFIVNKFAKKRGGTAGNLSYSLSLLKTKNLLFSYAGLDFNDYINQLKKLGIILKGVKIDKSTYTATGFAMTDKNQNQIWGFYYGASEKNINLKLKDIVKKNDLVIVGPAGAAASMNIVRQCIILHAPYMFDPGFILTQIDNKELLIGLESATYIIGNEYEINLMKSRIKNWDKITKNKITITTLGENGTIIKDKNTIYKIPIVPVKKVLSTTGAGDAWRAGFLAGIERNLKLQICGQLGSVAASFAVEKFGTQEHIYTKSEFEKRYRQTFKKIIKL